MFVDEVKIKVTSGAGGNGIISYRREKYIEFGGPWGGSGGNGGSIIFVGDEGMSTLLDFRYNRHIKGNPGERGMSKGMNGRNALDTYVKVPLGSTIYDNDLNKVIGDITEHGQELVVCKGGRGGRGNIAFATHKNPCPAICEKGEAGTEKNIRIELKVLADCGLVGYPSVGKSTLISVISNSRPKIAAYHFTTLNPNLGVVGVPDGRSFVVADLPGLIEGASQGLGLGLEFLRHIERCRVIVHVIDMASVDGRNPYEDYVKIRHELESYKFDLLKRPEVIVANKMDLEGAKENLEEFKKHVDKEIFPISAYTKEGLTPLLYRIRDLLDVTPNFTMYEDKDYVQEYNFTPEEEKFVIENENGVYNIKGAGLKRLFEMTDFSSYEATRRFARQLKSMGIDDELRRLGVKNGDLVKIFDYEFEFID
ncbi:MAG: GTPase ObgE [Acholeplasmatales bacterium]|nr:GTPase ObgE [Acholeplasmatales bacterium]